MEALDIGSVAGCQKKNMDSKDGVMDDFFSGKCEQSSVLRKLCVRYMHFDKLGNVRNNQIVISKKVVQTDYIKQK